MIQRMCFDVKNLRMKRDRAGNQLDRSNSPIEQANILRIIWTNRRDSMNKIAGNRTVIHVLKARTNRNCFRPQMHHWLHARLPYRSHVLSGVYRNANTRLRGYSIDRFGQPTNKWILTNNSRDRSAASVLNGSKISLHCRCICKWNKRFSSYLQPAQEAIRNVDHNRMKIPSQFLNEPREIKIPVVLLSILHRSPSPFRSIPRNKTKGRTLPSAFYARYVKSRVLQWRHSYDDVSSIILSSLVLIFLLIRFTRQPDGGV